MDGIVSLTVVAGERVVLRRSWSFKFGMRRSSDEFHAHEVYLSVALVE